jgi:CRISPR-associated protein Cmr6
MAYILDKHKNSNLGWLYYKYYFEKQEILRNDETTRNKDIIANRNETIIKTVFRNTKDCFDLLVNAKSICLRTVYPGLLIGSGYTHESIFKKEEDKDEAFKIGFFFDHVTGMPYIPGHSVKGTLRSAFPNHKNEKYLEEKSEAIVNYLEKGENVKMEECFKEYLEKLDIQRVPYTNKRFATLLGNIIFEGKVPYAFNFEEKSPEKQDFIYKQISIYERDVFQDSYLSEENNGKEFLGTDYITPHANPLKNPKPIKFLKILPDIKIQFQFDLKKNLVSAELKEKLFREILLDFGIGAKTNVGYGQFSEV